MRKRSGFVAAMVVSAMMLMALPAAGGEAGTLPAPGEVIENFAVLEERSYKAVDAQTILLEHQSTGAKVMLIANDDVNRVFDLTFWTHAEDDTGLPHVFEHATLDGSRKYPSKGLFFNLIYQTYNTYINASTYDRMTTFPIASLSEEQLLRYADYYTDSCFHPSIMEDESIFREEAWRYRLEDENAPLTMEGTVYSEMLGSVTLERKASANFLADAFPGSWIRYISGGNPDVIPEMTYDSLKAYHDRYYHPSNCMAFLYGQIDDYAAFLKVLDEAFSEYDRREFAVTDPEYEPVSASVENTWLFPVEADSDVNYASSVYYGILMPELQDEDELMKMDLLSSILGAGYSPLSQAMRTALPYAAFSCYLEMAGPQPVMVFAADNVNPGDEAVFRQTVDEALKDLAENGISEELAEAVESSLVLSSRLRREDSSVGVSLIAYLAYNAALYNDCWSGLSLEDYQENMALWSQDGTLAELAGRYLTGDVLTVLSLTSPEAGAKEEHDAALAASLAGVKEQMSDEEIGEIVAVSQAPAAVEDASQYVKQLQAVTVDTLPEELALYDLTDETDDQGVRHVEAEAGVSGVGMAELMLDAGGLSVEDLRWMRLLTELGDYLDTRKHTRQELAVLKERFFYGGAVSYAILREDDGPHPYYTISWICLTEDLEKSYDLAYELAFEQALDEEHLPQLGDALQGLAAGRKNAITQNPYSIALYRGLARGDEQMALSDALGNTAYYYFLQEAGRTFEEDPSKVLAQLIRVRDLLASRAGAVAAYAGDPESLAKNRILEETFLDKLGDDAPERAEYSLDPVPDSYALIVDSQVCYNGFAADYETVGLDGFDAGIEVVNAVVLDQFLYPLLRDQYGAYGVFLSSMEDAGLYMLSYRDPNLQETYGVYSMLPQLIAQYPVDQETVNGYILSVYSGVALPQGELSGALGAIGDYLNGKDQERKLAWMEQIKAVTPETIAAFADVYQALVEKGVMISAGGASDIRSNAELFDEIEAPFAQTAAGEEEAVGAGQEEAMSEMDDAA